MKIISWNCNMAFRNKYRNVLNLEPDLLLIQECENQKKLESALKLMDYNEILWYGENPNKGVAAISFNEVEITLNSSHNEEFQYVIPIEVKNKKRTLDLFHIWAMPHKTIRKNNYIGQIWGALEYYSEFLSKDSLWIGDFNSNAIWDNKNRIGNHSDVVNKLRTNNIRSLYHLKRKELHGKELEPSFYLLKKLEKPYHLDYCFISDNLRRKNTNIAIGKYEEWIDLSDHMPIIIENIGL